MPSTYTTNLGIEKPATGEQSGTWGDTINLNYDMFDQAINGIVQVTLTSAGAAGFPTSLPITDGVVSNGRNKFIEFVDGGDLGSTAYVQLTPNTAEKIVHVRNSLSGSRSIILFQGTYNSSNDFEIPNGKDVLLKFSGTGAGAKVTDVFNSLKATGVDVATLSLNGVAVTSTAAELNFVDGVTSAIQTQLNAKQATITGAATTITSSNLATSRALASDGSGKVVVSSVTSTELGYLSGATSNIQTQINTLSGGGALVSWGGITGTLSNQTDLQNALNAKQATIVGGATTITSVNLTASRALASDASGKVAVSGATSTELGYLSGVTSAVQTQLNAKQATITGGATTITSSNLTTSRALVSDGSGKVAVSAATSTELGYLSGVTSAIQTQLNNKVSASSPIFTADALINNVTVGEGSGSLSTNTVVGNAALTDNTSGQFNTAIGRFALQANTTSNGNTAVGADALLRNVNGSNNTAVGYRALDSNTSGSGNAALGVTALGVNVSGTNNAAVGASSLEAATTAVDNTAMGTGSLKAATTGSYNAALGFDALSGVTTGSGNIGFGFKNNSGTYAPVFNPSTENNRLVAGHTAITNAYVQVAWTVVSDARDKTEIEGVPHGLAFVNQLQPVSYEFRAGSRDAVGDGIKRYGFLAQDILALEGDSPVIIDAEDSEKLRYRGESLVPVLVNAIKELSLEIEKLKGERNVN